MATNIITAQIKGRSAIADQHAYQYDYGMILQISGVDLPTAYQVDFSNEPIRGTAYQQIGNADGVAIPDACFESGDDIFAWVYLHSGEDDGETVYQIVIPVYKRSKTSGETPTPAQQSAIDEAIEALNEAVESADASAVTATEAAAAATESAAQAATSAEGAEHYAQEAAASAEEAAGYVVTVSEYASQAAASATAAASSATSADHSADEADTSADAAAISATNAAASATAASGSATTATQKATEAANSATAASNSATTASTKADEAAASAAEAAETVAGITDDLMNKADVITDTASGSIVSISDGMASPVLGLDVEIEPIQDLHGYANPWPAGGGKNIMPPNAVDETVTKNGLTLKCENGVYILSGTSTTETTFVVPLKSGFTSPVSIGQGGSGCLYFLNTSVDSRITINFMNGSTSIDIWVMTTINRKHSGYSVLGNKYIDGIGVYVGSNITVSMTISPMFTNDGTDNLTSFYPYSNICPVSGRTGAKVTRTGRNLLDIGEFGFYHGTMTKNEDGSITISTTSTSSLQRQMRGLLKAGRYTISNLSESLDMYVQKSGADYSLVVPKGNSASFDYDGVSYLRFLFVNQAANTTTTYKLQLELGSTAHAYEPYTAVTHEIPFSTEVYGGTLNVETGELVVDRTMVDLGTLTWNASPRETTYKIFSTNGIAQLIKDTKNNWTIPTNFICSQYKTVTFNIAYAGETDGVISYAKDNHSVNLVDSNFANYSTTEVATALSGVQLVYELATPVEVTLTPHELDILFGDNNIWADSGNVSVEYRCDTKKYILKKIAEALNA